MTSQSKTWYHCLPIARTAVVADYDPKMNATSTKILRRRDLPYETSINAKEKQQ